MRATFICGGTHVPASRFRVHPIERGLREKGWDTGLVHGYGDLDGRIGIPVVQRAYRAACRLRRAVRTATMRPHGPVMVQRLAWPWDSRPEVKLSARCSGLVFDFDDAVFLGEGGAPSPRRRRALSGVFAAASHVVAGNEWLAQAVDADVPVSVIPTCIDTGLYRPGPGVEPEGEVKIGWIGTSGNFPYLRHLVEGLAALRSSGRKYRFLVCSDVDPGSLGVELAAEFTKWTPTGELAFLQSLDIGLMPLDDTDWCKGKCSFKLIQYMATGCPVVASAVGFNIDVVADGEVGYLVDDADWYSRLATLIDSAELRKTMGASARKRAVALYDIQRAVVAYEDILGRLQ
ncbi:glycosyltransferase family 4 protein [Luteimonas sp. A501]